MNKRNKYYFQIVKENKRNINMIKKNRRLEKNE